MQFLRTIFGVSVTTPPAPWKSEDLDPQTIEAISRDILMDLAVRISHAFYAYPLLLIGLGTTSTFPAEHPAVWWTLAAVLVLVNLARVGLVLRRGILYDRFPVAWWTILSTLTVSVSAAMGAFLMLSAWWYPLLNWNTLAPLVFSIGLAGASLITMTPCYGLMRAHVLLLTIPCTVALALKGDAHSWTFAVGFAVFSVFLLIQGAALHRSYLALRWEQAVSRKRSIELEQARRAAEAASEAKSQFLASLSHEIRTPMNGILGMARLALDAEPEPAVRESIETLEQCAFGLLGLLNDMLDFSKIEAGKLVLEHIPFAPHDLLHEAAGILAAQARIKGLELETTAPEERFWLDGDPVRLRQVLVNLIGNAVKFTETGSVKASFTILPDAKHADSIGLEFAVEDSGIGIDPSLQDLIFEPFRQADGSVTRRFGGTGLGLAICARIVEAMGGRIQLESRPGHGSRFCFQCEFTRTSDESLANLHRATADLLAAIRTRDLDPDPVPPRSILVAEDNPVNQRLLERLLHRQGHRVVVVDNGRQALEAVRRNPSAFDLVLMDISMPEMDGMEATRLLREFEASGAARTPVVALTANAMQGDRERFLAAGMDGYLAKPFSLDELDAIVRRHARQSSAQMNSSYSG